MFEVGARAGRQNEAVRVPTAFKTGRVDRLSAAGRLIGAFLGRPPATRVVRAPAGQAA